jgi:hypothetical protein
MKISSEKVYSSLLTQLIYNWKNTRIKLILSLKLYIILCLLLYMKFNLVILEKFYVI